ncbi:flagellar motor protein MotB [Pseudomonas sp. Leaf127]|uniref:OmpA family protein n=1 Tax=Pseudomonas sp. Leaf127 TaxID=1736267 RepID=UPI00070244B1|nr:OmpA family protein [Pseudomonas sp. Leaf127]KQQ56038.1 flagellar motor protein MotB [Pseudomonas sp. Leaf127]
MTVKLIRGLWLWAGALTLAVQGMVALTAEAHALVVLMIAGVVLLGWRQAGLRQAQQGRLLDMAEGVALPPANYRQPLVIVCGDGLTDLFGAAGTAPLALRMTDKGCYLRAADLRQLPALVASLLTLHPQWRAQLSVLFVASPQAHAERMDLSAQVRSLAHQFKIIRRRGLTLPLMVVSYLQTAHGHDAWFGWQANRTQPQVYGAGACCSLMEWQRLGHDEGERAARLQACVQLDSAAAWLAETVQPHWPAHAALQPVAWALTLVPTVPQRVAGNLWQQWLRDKTALIDARSSDETAQQRLLLPDPLLHLLPVRRMAGATQKACVTALWLFALAGLAAMSLSARNNTLLLRQVSADLQRYQSIPQATQRSQPEFALGEEALAVLNQNAVRLEGYYRYGAPWSLGLGLYQGEYLRPLLQSAIGSHRQPPYAPPAPQPAPVRLDSLSLFNTASARLKPESTKVLINALVDIKAQPGWLIVIAGHTDATGNAEHNLHLSRARAAAVRDWMQRMGDLPDSCFAVQGFGASQPIASNDTESGRTANRRVDIRLVPEAGACVLSASTPGRQPPSPVATSNH